MAALLLCSAVAAAAAAARPNILVLFVDDMGIDQIQAPVAQRAYGYTGNNGTIQTPHISLLAKEGMVFQNWYSGFHVCTPSRAAMMTGRLPVRSGIGSSNAQYAPHAPGPSQGSNNVFTAESIGGLPLNETTLAEALKPAGYATLAVGKWHLGQRDIYLPTARGFDSYLGIPFSQDIGLSFWATHGYKTSDPYFARPLPLLHNKSVLEQPANLFTIAEKYARIVQDFITTNAAASKPFFIYLPFNHIHGPNSCGARWCGQSARGPIGDATEEVDWVIGEVMSTLRSSAAKDNTIVFFTSDNGAPQRPDGNSPLRGFKGSVWEGGYREPGIAWWPGRIPAGSASGALVATYDIFPTVLKLAGVELPSDRVFDGIDMSPVLFQNATEAHKCIMFYMTPNSRGGNSSDNLAAVRCGEYKAYWINGDHAKQPPFQPQVYNLVTDPSESTPLSTTDPAYAPAVLAATAARDSHLATVEIVPDQNARGNNPDLAICGAPDSQKQFPQWPNCSLTPQFWTIPICLVDGWWCNQTVNGSCPAHCGGAPKPPGPGPAPKPPGPAPGPPLPPAPPMPPSAYMGCFKDHADGGKCDLPRNLAGHCKGKPNSEISWPRTVETCGQLCSRAGAYKYFGVQMGGDGCFCGDTFGSQGKVANATCNVPCQGDSHEMCGGPNLNSVYEVQRSQL